MLLFTATTRLAQQVSSKSLGRTTYGRSRVVVRRWLTSGHNSKNSSTTTTTTAAKEATTKVATTEAKKKNTSWWSSPEVWGTAGAMAGWGMSASAIYDAFSQGPEVISLTMTPVLIVYSTLFTVWSWVIVPKNLLLMSCHMANVLAQCNQLRRGVEYKLEQGEHAQVTLLTQQAAAGGAAVAASFALGPIVQARLASAGLGVVSRVAAADAGPFTVHFWAPASKWCISGASFLEFDRPTEKISLAQYTALTFTGLFFSRYSLLVIPRNINLSSVNVALFLSSAWHLGRKINADYIQGPTATTTKDENNDEIVAKK